MGPGVDGPVFGNVLREADVPRSADTQRCLVRFVRLSDAATDRLTPKPERFDRLQASYVPPAGVAGIDEQVSPEWH